MKTKCIPLIILCLLFLGCTKDRENITIDPDVERHVLIDDGPPLSQIWHIEPVGGDSLITMDDTRSLQLFVDNRFVKTLGSKGRGPCEYDAARHFAVHGDTLYILDHTAAKMVYYSLSTDLCLGELSSPELSNLSSFIRAGGAFYLMHTGYTSVTPPTHDLLYKMTDGGVVTPIGFTIEHLQPNALLPPIMKSITLRERYNTLYMEFPFSDKLWMYDIVEGSMNGFRLSLAGHSDLRNHAMSSDMDEILRLINNTEMITGFFLLPDMLAIVTKIGAPPDIDRKITFYDYNGIRRGEIKTDQHVFRVTDQYFSVYTEDIENPDTAHPYVILNYHYRINN